MFKALDYNSFINESSIKYKNEDIVCVDIQPEYKNAFKFNTFEFGDFINQNTFNNRIILLYNGEELGMISENDYKKWLVSECGVEDEMIDNIIFFEKNYAFFRGCMEEGIEDDALMIIGKYMYENDIADSRFLEDEDVENIRQMFVTHDGDIQELEKFQQLAIEEEEPFIIPELVDFLDNQNLKRVQLTGGGEGECLDEVQIAFGILGIKFNPIQDFIY